MLGNAKRHAAFATPPNAHDKEWNPGEVLIKPHIITGPEPLLSGQTYTALCGKEITEAVWVWQVVEPGTSARAILNRIGTCRKCWEQDWEGRYLYGAVSGQDVAFSDDDAERVQGVRQ